MLLDPDVGIRTVIGSWQLSQWPLYHQKCLILFYKLWSLTVHSSLAIPGN